MKININSDSKKCTTFREKKFELRNSVLTDLPGDTESHYHCYFGTCLLLLFGTVIYDFLCFNQVPFDIRLIHTAFGKFDVVIYSWMLFMLLTCLCYYCFNIWANVRSKSFMEADELRMWNNVWAIILVGYFVVSFWLSSYIVSTYQLPPASASIVLLEQVRLSMKVYAFIRTSAKTVLQIDPLRKQNVNRAKFSQYSFFLFAPTLVFSTDYPRTTKIRWTFATQRALEIAGGIFFLNFVVGRFLLPSCEEFGIRKFHRTEVFVIILRNCFFGILFYLTGFYLLFHSVQNLFAELLCFGDRLFYDEWWNCTHFSQFFRRWNLLVHDWLYKYLYEDVYEYVVENKNVAKILTFLISAVVHEWALTYILGYFFPGLSIYYLGFLLYILLEKKQQNNSTFKISFRIGLTTGIGILISVYMLEYFARINMKKHYNSIGNFYLPNFLICDCIN
nr:sterol O-acyltransferase 1-like isoform X1 [Leptinotarsa decemlineata]